MDEEEEGLLLKPKPPAKYNTLKIKFNQDVKRRSLGISTDNESIINDTISLISNDVNFDDETSGKKDKIHSTKAAFFPLAYIITSLTTIFLTVLFYYIEQENIGDMF
jgi:hypothetical protein